MSNSNKLESTCGNCENIRVTDCMGMYIFGCMKTGFIIPHCADNTTKSVTFWRVPESCPLTTGVKKSEEQAPQTDWIIKKFSDFKPE